jgi:phage terminase large subunit-like protein
MEENTEAIADPVLYVGIDVAYRRDTSAISAVYYDSRIDKYCLWGHTIFRPPVNISQQVTGATVKMLENHRIGKVLYDPYQFVSEAQRLEDQGYERLMEECNQMTENVQFANLLQQTFVDGNFLTYADPERRAHYMWCVTVATERGFRITKKNQSRQIDVVISDAMALYGCVRDRTTHHYPDYDEVSHGTSLAMLP